MFLEFNRWRILVRLYTFTPFEGRFGIVFDLCVWRLFYNIKVTW